MLNNRAEQIREWHEQAVYCAQQADARTDPKVKQQFLELKRLWLLLARRCGFTESPTDFSDEAVRGFLKHFARDKFRPDEISILEDALEDAWRRVKSSKTPWASEDYSTTGRSILAKYIIAMAKGGERDARWLADSSILYLSQQKIEAHTGRNSLTLWKLVASRASTISKFRILRATILARTVGSNYSRSPAVAVPSSSAERFCNSSSFA